MPQLHKHFNVMRHFIPSSIILILFAFLPSCKGDKYNITLDKKISKRSGNDENYFFSLIKNFEGITKFDEISGEVKMFYQVLFTFDTSVNSSNESLFKADTLYIKHKEEAYRNRDNGKIATLSQLKAKGVKQEEIDNWLAEGFIEKTPNNDTLSYNFPATEKLIVAPYYPSRTPAFELEISFTFLDKDGFEIFNLQVPGNCTVALSNSESKNAFQVSIKDNITVAKFKNINEFRNEILSKTNRILMKCTTALKQKSGA